MKLRATYFTPRCHSPWIRFRSQAQDKHKRSSKLAMIRAYDSSHFAGRCLVIRVMRYYLRSNFAYLSTLQLINFSHFPLVFFRRDLTADIRSSHGWLTRVWSWGMRLHPIFQKSPDLSFRSTNCSFFSGVFMLVILKSTCLNHVCTKCFQ